jgi:hypothetical protein
MSDILNPGRDTNTNQYHLIELTVADAARARLLEEFDRYQELPPDDDDDAAPVLAVGFWILLAVPFVALFLTGLMFGGF